MNRIIKKALTGLLALSMLVTAAPVAGQAATVTKGSYDFSKMVVRRVWFNTNDPVFLIDNYQRVWLDENANVLATGKYNTTTSAGDLMAPMKEMFEQIGVDYTETGDDITITLNGETLKLTIGSSDVVFKGNKITGALSTAQVPKKVNAKTDFAEYNTFLTGDYLVTYLPVAYVLDTFGADMYVDSNVQSFYAAIPVMTTANTPSYTTVAQGYGSRYDGLTAGTLSTDTAVADNIVALQNEDGGFQALPANTDMAQSDLASKLGTLKDTSTLIDGATTAELKYLAKYITETKPANTKYRNAFKKGIEFLTANQHASGAWQMSPTAAAGFNANLEVGNMVTTEVLSLLSDVAVLNNQNYVFARKIVDVNAVKAAVAKGNDFLVSSQVTDGDVKTGWASQYKTDGTVTMGRTYERESVSSFTTKAVAEYLMTIHDPSAAIQEAVKTSVQWLDLVKIKDKKVKSVPDTSMNNGFDIYLVDGAGTWASNYKFDTESKTYKPLYSDVDPKRAKQPYVNTYDLKGVNTANDLIAVEYPQWQGYVANGFPAVPVDPEVSDAAAETVIDIKAGEKVAPSVFESIKSEGKSVTFNVIDSNGKTVATWKFDGNTISNSAEVSLNVVVNAIATDAQKLINKTNAADKSLVIHFDYSGVLPGPAAVKVSVSDKFANGTQLKLYYYNEKTGKLEYQNQTVTVTDGFAEFTISHCSDYVLSDATLGDKLDNAQPLTGDRTNVWIYALIAGIASLIACGTLVYEKKRKKEVSDK